MSPSGEPEAVDVPANPADAAADFENYLFGDDDEQNEPDPEGDDGDEPELDPEGAEQDDEQREPEKPAIAAPVSLNAEEKAAFLAASPEAQQAWAAAENRRNAQVQEATTKASAAQQQAQSAAAAADAQAKALYGQQLEKFVAAFKPHAPDPSLAYQNPAQYIAEKAQYDAQAAQFDELVQQVRGVQTEAQQEADAAFLAQRDRELMSHPKIANSETRDEFLKGIFDLASEVGFAPDQIVKHASGPEVLALAKVYERLTAAEEKAAKYDKAMSRQMQKVRAGKQRNLRPNAAPHDPSRAANADKAWQRVTTTRNKAHQAEAFADYLEATGHL